MSIFQSVKLFINDADDLVEKANRYKAIIRGLEDAALVGVENQDIDEYWIDTGQSKIKTIYRSPTQIANAIIIYDRLLQRCLNQLNGRVVRLVDFNSNFINRNRH